MFKWSGSREAVSAGLYWRSRQGGRLPLYLIGYGIFVCMKPGTPCRYNAYRIWLNASTPLIPGFKRNNCMSSTAVNWGLLPGFGIL